MTEFETNLVAALNRLAQSQEEATAAHRASQEKWDAVLPFIAEGWKKSADHHEVAISRDELEVQLLRERVQTLEFDKRLRTKLGGRPVNGAFVPGASSYDTVLVDETTLEPVGPGADRIKERVKRELGPGPTAQE